WPTRSASGWCSSCAPASGSPWQPAGGRFSAPELRTQNSELRTQNWNFCGVRADAEAEREDRDEREAAMLHQRADAEAEILDQFVHPTISSRVRSLVPCLQEERSVEARQELWQDAITMK